MPKKNILYISPNTSVRGGISTLLISYFESELSVKYRLMAVFSHRTGTKATKLFQAIKGLIHVCYHLVSKEIDVVHIHGGGCTSALRKYVFFRLVKLFGRRVIYHLHGGAFPQQFRNLSSGCKCLIIQMLEKSDLVICLSEYFRNEIRSIAPGATLKVLMNSVPLPHGMNRHSQKRSLRIVFLGLVNDKKGIFDLLRVMKKVCDETSNCDIQLEIGGAGEVERMYKEIQALRLEEHIVYRGWLKPEERDKLLRSADIFVLPSYSEGMPISILEAMSFGIPVLSSRVGGIPEIVTDGETGFLVEPGNLEQMYDKLCILIRDDRCREFLGSNGRKLVEAKHDIAVHIRRIDAVYSSIGVARTSGKRDNVISNE
jgi:glycosyltransferase involved in cell wall biosynthesis